MAFEDQPSVRVVLPEDRNPRLEDEVVAAARVDQRQTAVERQMYVSVVFVSGASEDAEGVKRVTVETELGQQPAKLGLAHDDCASGELQRRDAREHDVPQGDPRSRATGEPKPADAGAIGVEDLHPLASVWRVRHHEPAVRAEVERARAQQSAVLGTDLDDSGGLTAPAHLIHAVAPAIEYVIVAVGGLLKGGGLLERADDGRGQAARRPQLLDGS